MSSPFPPSVMRTWQYTGLKGGIEKNLKLNTTNAVPTPKPDQHLVQVIAVALNPVDYKPAETFGRLVLPKVATPGIDFSGVIVTPAANSSLKRGQVIYGSAALTPFAAGGLSEFTTVPEKTTTALPAGLSPLDAATITVAGLTAWQSIVPHVKAGDRVFINGGSGGTGSLGIQMAKASSCHVTTCCSTANVELCRSLGADEVIDYKTDDVVETLCAADRPKFDHVVDNVGTDPQLYWQCHRYTNPTAKFILVAGYPTLGFFATTLKMKRLPAFLGGGKRTFRTFWPDVSLKDLDAIGRYMAEGKIKAVVDSTFAFDDAPRAFERLKTGRARGKVVVDVASKTYRKDLK